MHIAMKTFRWKRFFFYKMSKRFEWKGDFFMEFRSSLGERFFNEILKHFEWKRDFFRNFSPRLQAVPTNSLRKEDNEITQHKVFTYSRATFCRFTARDSTETDKSWRWRVKQCSAKRLPANEAQLYSAPMSLRWEEYQLASSLWHGLNPASDTDKNADRLATFGCTSGDTLSAHVSW